MDRERFGRALGTGAREAGKALWKAADAAASPSPAPPAPAPRPAATSRPATSRVTTSRVTTAGVKREGRKFGQAVWGPVARASGVLWLEVTGVFFGLFALTAAIEVWKRHRDYAAGGEGRQHLYFAVGMLVVFGWFTVSSFLRARKRARQ